MYKQLLDIYRATVLLYEYKMKFKFKSKERAIMKKLIAFVLSAVMAAAFAGCGSKPAESPANQASGTAAVQEQATQESLDADVKAELDSVLSKNNFKGVVQITKGGAGYYQYVNGNDDNEKPLTIDASLPIGSVSKQFCAACVMLLCDQKKLSADDTLDKYFAEYKEGKKLTVKNLLNMSSGIRDYLELVEPSAFGTNEKENIAAIKKAIFNEELIFEPGDNYGYSNSNYFLLAEIVEQVSGVPYHEFLRKNFFEPLEMTHTGFTDEITGDNEWSSALSETKSTQEGFYNPGLTKGAGDVVSNAADMDKWMRGLSGGKVISPDAFRQMTQNANPDSADEYCYGFWHMPYGGAGHVGQIPPHFGAVDYINTDRDIYLFAVSNTGSGMSYVQQIPQTLLGVLFGKEEATKGS